MGIDLSFKLLKTNQIVLLALLLSVTSSVCAQKQNSGKNEYISSSKVAQATNAVEHPANSFVELDFSLAQGESWDAKDQTSNMIVNCVDGSIITGFETSNVVIKTVGRSYFSEATIYFSNSAQGNDGIEFAVGAGNNNSGVSSFSTNGILDITDSDNFDVESLSDNKFYLQFYEVTDDLPNEIDARFTSGKLKIWGVGLKATNSCPFVTAVAEADISVSYSSDKRGDLLVGDNLAFEIIGTNNSSNTAINVVLKNSLSENLQLVDLSCDNGFSTTDASAAQSVVIGDVLANSSFVCTMNTELLSVGGITNTVNIVSDNDDDLSNNSTVLVVVATANPIPASNWLMLSVLFLLLISFGFREVR